MSIIRSEISHLEKSLKKYLEDQISTDTVTVLVDGNNRVPEVRISDEFNNDWNLPVIQLRVDSIQRPKPFIGQTKVTPVYLCIIDIYATNNYERINLAEYIAEKLETGFEFIIFTNNPANANSPLETVSGHVSTIFLTDQKINLGLNINAVDKYRHRLTLNMEIGNI